MAVAGVIWTRIPESIVRFAVTNAFVFTVLVTRISAVFGVGRVDGAV